MEFSVFCNVRLELLRPILVLLDPAKHLRMCVRCGRGQVTRALELIWREVFSDGPRSPRGAPPHPIPLKTF